MPQEQHEDQDQGVIQLRCVMPRGAAVAHEDEEVLQLGRRGEVPGMIVKPSGRILMPMTPIKFTAERQAKYLEKLAKGGRRGKSAKAVGVSYSTVQNYVDRDPVFAAAIREAEEMAAEDIEDTLWETARAGNMTAMMFWLQNRAPDRWKDMRRIEKKVTHEGTIIHELEAAPALERIALLQARLQERLELRSGPPELGPAADVVDAEVVGD